MKKKFAFLLMGKEFDTAKDTAVFETEHMISYIFTVTSFEEALKRAVACAEDGVGAIEVCGAFGKEWADKIIAAVSAEPFKIASVKRGEKQYRRNGNSRNKGGINILQT